MIYYVFLFGDKVYSLNAKNCILNLYYWLNHSDKRIHGRKNLPLTKDKCKTKNTLNIVSN